MKVSGVDGKLCNEITVFSKDANALGWKKWMSFRGHRGIG